MSQLEPERQRKLVSSAERAFEKLCTIKRTLNHGVETLTEAQGPDAQDLPAVS